MKLKIVVECLKFYSTELSKPHHIFHLQNTRTLSIRTKLVCNLRESIIWYLQPIYRHDGPSEAALGAPAACTRRPAPHMVAGSRIAHHRQVLVQHETDIIHSSTHFYLFIYQSPRVRRSGEW